MQSLNHPFIYQSFAAHSASFRTVPNACAAMRAKVRKNFNRCAVNTHQHIGVEHNRVNQPSAFLAAVEIMHPLGKPCPFKLSLRIFFPIRFCCTDKPTRTLAIKPVNISRFGMNCFVCRCFVFRFYHSTLPLSSCIIFSHILKIR